MTYKSRTRGNAVLLDSEVLEASKKATGIDPMIAIREKYPDAELIFSTREQIDRVRSPLDPYRHLEDFKRGYHDEMTYYGPADRDYQLPIVVSHENLPYFIEGELYTRALKHSPFVPHVYPHQEEVLRRIKELGPTLIAEVESCHQLDIGISIHGKVAFDIEAGLFDHVKFRPLVINPRRKKIKFDSYSDFGRPHVIWDEAHIRNELVWGLDIRYKFAREAGKTHAQICKEELKTIRKRRKAAMKQLDLCGARYEAALKENENV